jgi:hypothetical protein
MEFQNPNIVQRRHQNNIHGCIIYVYMNVRNWEGMASAIPGDELCGEVQVTHLPVWQHLKCDEEFAFLSYILFIPSERNACLLVFE